MFGAAETGETIAVGGEAAFADDGSVPRDDASSTAEEVSPSVLSMGF